MKTLTKVFVILFILSLSSIVFVKWVYSLSNDGVFSEKMEGLTESSFFKGAKQIPTQSIEGLFRRMGIERKIKINPCFDIEEYTQKYCTPANLQMLVSAKIFSSFEEELFQRYLNRQENPCEQTAVYIGKLCELQNLKKILKHFSGK